MDIADKKFLAGISVLAVLGCISMLVSILYAFNSGHFLDEFQIIGNLSWGFVSIIDLYFGLFVFSLWVLWREKFSLTGLFWSVLIIGLGNLSSSVYLLVCVFKANGDVKRFCLGRNYDAK